MPQDSKAIYWFRQDLRLQDNPALSHACQNHAQVYAIYIFDNHNPGDYSLGAASKWWLHQSLESLGSGLCDKLNFYSGDPLAILQELVEKHGITAIYWNRVYEPWQIERDTKIKEYFSSQGLEVKSYNASMLWEPWQVQKNDGTPYKVFTPFYRKGCLESAPPREPLAKPENPHFAKAEDSLKLKQLNLLPTKNWYRKFEAHWEVSEQAAHAQFKKFIAKSLHNYKDGRNLPAKSFVSGLSPYIHFGQISVHFLWHKIQQLQQDDNTDCFCSELGWREFSHSLLFYNRNLPKKNLQMKFDNFPWHKNASHLKAWQLGKTGIPMVDAGMRELWQTGYMHNRARMIVGSFLVKNLRISWREGERWFWDCLVDADLANNAASWQWVAGCGADAAPYFRIFNPVAQGQKFDPEGQYIRKFIPEIAALPNKYLFYPWEAPQAILDAANLKLGEDYPLPIVDLKASREEALRAFQSLRESS